MTTRSCRLVGALSAAALLAPWAHTAQGASPGDPLLSRQWGLSLVQAPGAWRTSTGRGVIVAVLDTGIERGHPDLQGALLPGRNMVDGSTRVDDEDCGHGTRVAGIVAARRHNGLGIAGVAPDARVLPLKVGNCAATDNAAVVAGIRFAVAQGARVVNLSHASLPGLGVASAALGRQAELQGAVDEAWAKGVLVVAAAGNYSVPLCEYPALTRRVLCVGAADRDSGRAYYSEGSSIASEDFLMAPGGGPSRSGENGVWTTTPSSRSSAGSGEADPFPGFTTVQGTSFAAPHVSGVAALLFSRGYSAAEVRRRILTTARDLGPVGPDPLYGAGLVDAAAAVRG